MNRSDNTQQYSGQSADEVQTDESDVQTPTESNRREGGQPDQSSDRTDR